MVCAFVGLQITNHLTTVDFHKAVAHIGYVVKSADISLAQFVCLDYVLCGVHLGRNSECENRGNFEEGMDRKQKTECEIGLIAATIILLKAKW